MPLRHWKPLRLSFDLEKQIDELFSELIHVPWGKRRPEQAWQPAVDLYETENSYLIEIDLPGVAPEEIEIHVEERSVTISGSRHATSWLESAHEISIERRQGQFTRTFHLASRVDPQRVERRHEAGIHYVRIWKVKPDREQH